MSRPLRGVKEAGGRYPPGPVGPLDFDADSGHLCRVQAGRDAAPPRTSCKGERVRES